MAKKKTENVEKKQRAVKAKAKATRIDEEVIINTPEPVEELVKVEMPQREASVAETPKKEEVKAIAEDKPVVKKKINRPAVGYCWNGWQIDSF